MCVPLLIIGPVMVIVRVPTMILGVGNDLMLNHCVFQTSSFQEFYMHHLIENFAHSMKQGTFL